MSKTPKDAGSRRGRRLKPRTIISIIFAGALVALLITAFASGGAPAAAGESRYYGTAWSLFPPLIAIVLALITKEVYSSLFIGIFAGALLYSNFNFEGAVLHTMTDGIVSVLTSAGNIHILCFVVLLAAVTELVNKTGGAAAFGRWARIHIKSRVGAELATAALGVLIFIDDGFNCMTVGSVMRPITDEHRVSRAKLAYFVDSTAAPVCIIAPISSWAAAVSGFAAEGQGLSLFIRAIPYNFYALLTLLMIITIALMKTDYGPMARYEKNAAEKGDLFSGENPYAASDVASGVADAKNRGRMADLVFPIAAVIVCCIIGIMYFGGFFSGTPLIEAVANSDAASGLMLGSFFALLISYVYFAFRRTISFRDMINCIPEGFRTMVPPMLILIFAWTLKAMTDSLGAAGFVADFVYSRAESLRFLLPAIVFVIGCLLSFSTGTSWGTFGILIPIVQGVFPADNPLSIICVSACLAGAVCGDHCSPISDTTIMSSAGSHCDHVTHVSTQLPYAITVAAVSFVSYIIAGLVRTPLIALPVAALLMLATLFVIKKTIGVRTA